MYRNAIVALFLSVVVASAFAGTSTKVFDNNAGAGDNSFTTPTNWSPNGVPGNGDDLVIAAPCNVDSNSISAYDYNTLSFSTNGNGALSWTDPTARLSVSIITPTAFAGGAIDMSGGGILALTGAGTPFDLTNLLFFAGNGAIEYAGPSTQTITAGPTAKYFNLIVTGPRTTSNVLLQSGPIEVVNIFDAQFAGFDPGQGIVAQNGSSVAYTGTQPQLIAKATYDSLTLVGSGEKVIMDDVLVQSATNLILTTLTISTNGNLATGLFFGDAQTTLNLTGGQTLEVNAMIESGFDGTLNGGGDISKKGTAIFNLGSNGSGFHGTTTIHAGTIVLHNGIALGTSMVSVTPDSALIAATTDPVPLYINVDNATLGGAFGSVVFSGVVNVNVNANLSLRDFFDPTLPCNVEITGFLNLSTGAASVVGPQPTATFPLPPSLKISGDLNGGTVNAGPSAEIVLPGPGYAFGTTLNMSMGSILTAVNGTPFPNQSVNVNLAAGSILRGTAEFSATSVITSTGGVIQPGPANGTGTLPLTTGSGSPSTLTLNNTSTVEFRAGSAGQSDKITVSGALTLGSAKLAIKPVAGFGAGTYTLFTHGGLTGTATFLPPPPGFSFMLDTTTASNEVRLVVTVVPIVLTAVTPVSGEVGKDFSYSFTVTGDPSLPITITNTALPPGLRRQGLSILGTPTLKGSYTVTLTATNGVTTATQDVSFTINDPVKSTQLGPFAIEGRVGTSFFVDFANYISADDVAKNTFVATGLPDGVKVAGSTISGIPKTAGVFNGSVDAFDKANPTTKTGTATYTITILDKKATLGPVLTDLVIDPDQPGAGELTLFSIAATQQDNLPVTVTWDFGDSSATVTGAFVDHTYTTAGTYNLVITGTSGTGATAKTTTLTQAITVADVNPHAPVIVTFGATPSLSTVGQLVTFTASATDIDNDTVTYDWTFGDGLTTATGNSVTFTYTAAGSYLVTVVATDSNGLQSRTTKFLQFVVAGGGVPNIALDAPPIVSPLDGIGIVVMASDGGVIQLGIDISNLTALFSREDRELNTDFGFVGRRAVKGNTPVAQFTTSMLTVAKTTVRDIKTRKETGKARKTLAISKREVKETAVVETEPKDEDKKIKAVKLSGNFFPSRSNTATLEREAGADARAVKQDLLKSDTVTASAQITMPGGLDLTNGTEVQVALGNIIDKIVIDPKGKGKGRFTTLTMRITTDKKTKMSVADKLAKVSIKMSVAEMTANGFDTEGVVVSKEQNGSALSIQCAMLIGGVVYTQDSPVTLKVAPSETKATMITRRVTAPK